MHSSKTISCAAGGLHEEKNTLFLTLVEGRVHDTEEIGNLVVDMAEDRPVRVRDFARVERAAEPAATVVTADGQTSVLVMVRSQPDGSTLEIADQLKAQMAQINSELPPALHDLKMKFFYDQSLLVRDSVQSVWEAIIFGLILSVVILFLFLKDWGSTLVAIVVIPVTVLATLLAMRILGMSFNLMTLGGIAAAIGLVIDDAIVVVEAIHTKIATGMQEASGGSRGDRGNFSAADRLHAHAGGRLHSHGLPRRRAGRVFPGAGDHDDGVAVDVAGAGDFADAFAGGTDHPRENAALATPVMKWKSGGFILRARSRRYMKRRSALPFGIASSPPRCARF